MSESIVIVPSTANQDWDFLGFSFNGKHSWDDFKIIRTSDGDRYNINLGPQSQDKTAENPGGDGMYFFGSNHKQKVFDIKFAFEGLDDIKLREMKRWLSGKEVGNLWFDEEPYKVYSAKVTGQPNIRIIPFDDYNENGEKIGRVYKGDGSVQFTCYWPYAHTPDYVGVGRANGKNLNSYSSFTNKLMWAGASGLTSSTGTCTGENPGDLPAPFTLSYDGDINHKVKFTVGDLSIEIEAAEYEANNSTKVGPQYNLFKWDSKTGIVSAVVNNGSTPVVIPCAGEPCGALPVGNNAVTVQKWQGGQWVTDSSITPTLKYHYWYY